LDAYDHGSWPRYLPTESTLIRLDYQNETGTSLATSALYDAACVAVFPIKGIPGSTASSTVPATPSATGAAPSETSKHSAAAGHFAKSGSSAVVATIIVFIIGVVGNYM
jgi:hypothetical protein